MDYTVDAFVSSPLAILGELLEEAVKQGDLGQEKLASSDFGFVSEFLHAVESEGLDSMSKVCNPGTLDFKKKLTFCFFLFSDSLPFEEEH